MPGFLDRMKEKMEPFGKGLLAEALPDFAGGVIVELFHQWKITDAKIREDVKCNRSLWPDIGLDDQNRLALIQRQVGNLDFITPELIIDSIKEDFPVVASLFINWPEANEWLTRQIEELKREVSTQPPQ
jgi:hypothetical protein